MNKICIIPARAGSKRVPNKNFREMLNKPIIEYSIETALEFGFDSVIISSDNLDGCKRLNHLSNHCVEYMQRSDETSGDNATIFDAVKEVLENLGIKSGQLCILYPTACLTTPEQIKKAEDIMTSNYYDCVFPVIETGIHNQKILDVFMFNVTYKYPQFNTVPSQACTEIYAHAGSFFYCDIEAILEKKSIITDNCGCLKLKPWEACEVDTEDDWKMLEILMKSKYNII